MARTLQFLKRVLSLEALSFLWRVPRIIWQLENWGQFLLNYAGVRNEGAVYRFRNGLSIETGDGLSAATIAVVFFKKDYGDVQENSIVIDIGANIGVFALYAAQTPGTCIYAFEPAPSNFAMLQRNIAHNAMEKRILAFQTAIAGTSKKRTLYLREDRSPCHSLLRIEETPFQEGEGRREQELTVSAVTLEEALDRYSIEECGLLKIDCEGAEFEILYAFPAEGCARIKRVRMEYHDQGGDNRIDRLLPFLRERGFAIEKWHRRTPRKGDLWLERR